jgi:hypothetical protein
MLPEVCDICDGELGIRGLRTVRCGDHLALAFHVDCFEQVGCPKCSGEEDSNEGND